MYIKKMCPDFIVVRPGIGIGGEKKSVIRSVSYRLSFQHIPAADALSYVIEKHLGAKIICVKSSHCEMDKDLTAPAAIALMVKKRWQK